MNQISIDSITDAASSIVHVIGFQDFVKTLCMLKSVYTDLELIESYGKPNACAALAFYIGMKCAQTESKP